MLGNIYIYILFTLKRLVGVVIHSLELNEIIDIISGRNKRREGAAGFTNCCPLCALCISVNLLRHMRMDNIEGSLSSTDTQTVTVFIKKKKEGVHHERSSVQQKET